MTVHVKNTDRASRPAVLSDGRQIDPGEFGEAPDDATTADLIDTGWLTRATEGADETTVPTGSIAAIEKWVGEDKDRAAHALAAEQASDSPRSTLVDALNKLIGSEES